MILVGRREEVVEGRCCIRLRRPQVEGRGSSRPVVKRLSMVINPPYSVCVWCVVGTQKCVSRMKNLGWHHEPIRQPINATPPQIS